MGNGRGPGRGVETEKGGGQRGTEREEREEERKRLARETWGGEREDRER